MSTMWTLLPIKPFDAAKARLAGKLALPQRQALAHAMADDVVTALKAAPNIDRIFVCSSGAAMADWARAHGVAFIAEPDAPKGLNATVGHAAQYLKQHGAKRLMVAHADLPFVSAHEIQTFSSSYLEVPAVSIAPDRWKDGSNLLAWDMGLDFHTHYGPGSFEKHLAEARRLGAGINICRLPGAAIDVDTEADFDFLINKPSGFHCGPQTQKFLDDYTQSQTKTLPVTEKNG